MLAICAIGISPAEIGWGGAILGRGGPIRILIRHARAHRRGARRSTRAGPACGRASTPAILGTPKEGHQSEGSCRERAQGSGSCCRGLGRRSQEPREGARAARRHGGPGRQLLRGRGYGRGA
eukprot:6425692-Prymnesium_polylepis.1